MGSFGAFLAFASYLNRIKMSSQTKNSKPFKSKLPKFTFLKRNQKKPYPTKSSPTPSCKKEKDFANLVEKASRKNSIVETKIPVLSAKIEKNTIVQEKSEPKPKPVITASKSEFWYGSKAETTPICNRIITASKTETTPICNRIITNSMPKHSITSENISNQSKFNRPRSAHIPHYNTTTQNNIKNEFTKCSSFDLTLS